MPLHVPAFRGTERILYRDLKCINLRECISQLHTIDFSPIYLNAQPDIQVSHFSSSILNLYHDNVPLRRMAQKDVDEWMNHPEIRIAKIRRDVAFTAMRENRTDSTVKNYCYCKNKVKSIIRKIRRRTCINSYENCSQQQLWRKLRLNGVVGDGPSLFSIDPDEFNNFVRMPPVQASTISFNYNHYRNNNGFVFRNVDDIDVFNAMSKLHSNSIGPDGIPLNFIKLIFSEIVAHLTYIFNTCITRSEFPTEWKLGRVIPLPKVRNPNSVDDFRPITILSCFAKIFEIILKEQILNHLDELQIFNPFQSGFRKGYSTSTLMLDIVESIRSYQDRNLLCALIFLDFHKAFDSLNHDLLAIKLIEQFNFNPLSSKLVFSFLNGRTQFVRVGDSDSRLLYLHRGVPQGSILGPLLLLLFLNDMYTIFSTFTCYTYADDVQLLGYSDYNNIRRFEEKINIDLRRVTEWCNQNFLDLNINKCKMMIFSKNNDFNLNIFLNGERIEIVDVHKSLGFFIDNKLSFNQHINYVVSRISFILRKLYNVSTYLPMAIRRKVGISLCFPLFLYGLEMYSCTSRENLNSLQLCINRVVRFIYKLGVREHVSGYRFQLLNYDFDDFISSRQIILFYRFKKYNCPSYLARKFENLRF